MSGVVDTDRFPTPINFPFVVVAADGVHVLSKGTPLVQAIAFRRADAAIEGIVRAEWSEERDDRARTFRSLMAGGSWYRHRARVKR